MMKSTKFRALVVCFVACTLLVSGCENLRRKFTRKRKPQESTETVVLVPRDYSANPLPNDVLYKQHFAYWKSWNQELVSSMSDIMNSMYNEKKIDLCVEQSLSNLQKMQSLLTDEKAQELGKFVKQTQNLKKDIIAAKTLPPSRMNSLKYTAGRILSNVNRNFDYRHVKDDLK